MKVVKVTPNNRGGVEITVPAVLISFSGKDQPHPQVVIDVEDPSHGWELHDELGMALTHMPTGGGGSAA